MTVPALRSFLVRFVPGLALLALPNVAAAAGNDAPIQRPTRAVAVANPAQPPATSTSTQEVTFTSSPAPQAAPTVAQAPPPTPPPTPRASSTEPVVGLHATAESTKKEKIEHRGFTLDARVGAGGCTGSLCRGTHNATPGVRLDGFIGGNIRGWVDLGIAGGWGTFGASVAPNSNMLRLYGIEPAQLQAAATAMGSPLGFNPFALQVEAARFRTARVGPALRIHMIPRGRGIAYIGAGFGYSTLLADYDTAVGNVSLRFHGLDVPLQAGGGVQISEHLAAVAQFDYTFTNYPLARFEHPQSSLTLPVTFLDSAATASTGTRVSKSLPQTWSISFGLRARF